MTQKMPSQSSFLKDRQSFFDEGMDILEAKNHDYAGIQNPWANFLSVEAVGLNPMEAMLGRMMDKMSRLGRLIKNPAKVKGETIHDTFQDLANYANLADGLYRYLLERK